MPACFDHCSMFTMHANTHSCVAMQLRGEWVCLFVSVYMCSRTYLELCCRQVLLHPVSSLHFRQEHGETVATKSNPAVRCAHPGGPSIRPSVPSVRPSTHPSCIVRTAASESMQQSKE